VSIGRSALATVLTLALAACGGDGSGSTQGTPGPIIVAPPNPTPTPTPAPNCSLRARQEWAAAAIREWYLFPETLPATLDPAPYATVQDYIDALTATARAQGKDRFFTYIASIAEEDAFFQSGATAAFGIRLRTDTANRQLFVTDSYEGAPALAAGIDRGAEILAIGPTPDALVSVATLIANGSVSSAFGPADAGVTRSLQLRDSGGTRTVTITKANFDIPPISPRYGTSTITADGQRIGYLNLRTFISTAEPALRAAFAGFRAEGITRVIIDFRYNGGGIITPAYLMADLMGQNRLPSDILALVSFRASKSERNQTQLFRPQPEAIAPMRIAFISTSATASASELVINSFVPYLKANAILVGANSFGKPVGQIGIDRRECDDRLRITAFALQNADRQGEYFRGLAGTVAASCAADDALAQPMGNPGEASTRAAIDALAGRACTPISVEARTQAVARAERRDPLLPEAPSAAQRELPGTF
jgi:C-terminal processing protease CtpA/Prc